MIHCTNDRGFWLRVVALVGIKYVQHIKAQSLFRAINMFSTTSKLANNGKSTTARSKRKYKMSW